MKRISSHSRLVAALVALAAVVPAAALAAGPSLTVLGPSTKPVNKNFRVGASGHVGKRRALIVTIHIRGQCAATATAEHNSPSSNAVFARAVGPGDFKETDGGWHSSQPTQGHFCAYLYKLDGNTYHGSQPPLAKSSKHFVITQN